MQKIWLNDYSKGNCLFTALLLLYQTLWPIKTILLTMKIIILAVGVLLLYGCSTKNVKISVESLDAMKDSIIIKDLITEKPIIVFSTCDKKVEFTINEPTIVSIESQNNPQRFSLLSNLYNGKSF